MAKKKAFLLSDSSVNSYGFRLDMSKLDLYRFSANPVMLYNHKELVGKWEGLEVKDDKLYGTPSFMDLESEPEAKRISLRVENGFVQGASLGINITKVTYPEGETPLVEAEVLECSVCDIPSNKNAIRVLNHEGLELTIDQIATTLSAFAEEKPHNLKPEIKMKLNALALVALGIQEGADAEAISAAIISLKAKADLADELKANAETEKKTRIDTMLSTATTEGKITAAEHADYRALAEANIDLCAKTLAKLNGKTSLNDLGGAAGGKSLSAIPEERKNWTRLEWAKNDTPGLIDLKTNSPELYAEISKR